MKNEASQIVKTPYEYLVRKITACQKSFVERMIKMDIVSKKSSPSIIKTDWERFDRLNSIFGSKTENSVLPINK